MPDYITIIESGSLGISTIATNLSTTSVAVAVGFIGATGPIGGGFDLNGPNNGLITRDGLEGNVGVAEAGFTYDANGTGYLSGKFGINTNNPAFTLDVIGSGNFSSGVYSNGSILATATNLASTGSTLATNLTSTGSTLTTSITSLSGTLTGGYATIANLASTGSTLNAKVDTLSGYANTTFATITNLASTGSTLVTNLASTGSTLTTSISSLSGTLTSNYATITNLASTGSGLNVRVAALSGNLISTGSTLTTSISNLSGTLTSNYATITNLASTGSTLNAKRLSTLSSSSTSNGTGNTVSGEWARIATTSQAANGRGSAWITITSDGGTIAPVARTFYVSKGSWHPEGGAISLLHQTISHASLDSIRMTNDTGTSKSNIDILWGAVVAAVNIKITVINDDSMNFSMGGYGYQSMYSGVTGLTPSENVVTSLNLTNNVVFGAASNSLGANAFVFNSSGIVVTGNRLVGQNDTGVLASAANLTSTGSTLTTSITSLSGTLTGSYVRLNESRPTVTSSSVSIGTATSTALLTVGTGSSTVAASGLAFGNDSGANLYRSAASTIKTDGDLIVAQNLTVTNHLSAATKSFLIYHPSEKGKMLQYGSLESPYHGVRLTGKNKLTSNSLNINLPSYISSLVHEDGVNIQLTNINHDKVLYVKHIDIQNNYFTVGVSYLFGDEYEFYWTFTAIRKDVPLIQVEH